MKSSAFILGVIGVLCFGVQARYTFNQGQQNDPMSVLRLLTGGNSKPDPKLKEGVIQWMKDQIDPELLKTWYGLSLTDRMCLQRSMTLAKGKIDQGRPEEAMEFIENYCPNAAAAAKKLYDGMHAIVKKLKAWGDSFLEDVPESIKKPMEEIAKRARWNELLKNKDKEENLVEMLDAIEELLTAPEEDRKALGDKHGWLAPFVNGDLYSDTLKLTRVSKKLLQNDELDNQTETIQLIKRWLKTIKETLMNYFETRERPNVDLPEDIETQFKQEVGILYDLIYNIYGGPFTRLYMLDSSAEEENSVEVE